MKWFERERVNHRIALTVEQRAVANELHERAQRLRDESGDLGVSESVKIAAFQMGLQEPDNEEVNEDGESGSHE